MHNYDLEERTAVFSENIIDFIKEINKDPINISILNQVTRLATSIGANYAEANGASSRKDFKNKIYICKKEAIETKYWLRILARAYPNNKEKCRQLWKEAHQLTLIFSKIGGSLKDKSLKIKN